MLVYFFCFQADEAPTEVKKRTFRKFTYKGIDLDALLDMNIPELEELFSARARRRFRPCSMLSHTSHETDGVIFKVWTRSEEEAPGSY